jgi:CRP-like cAMP-binding protein
MISIIDKLLALRESTLFGLFEQQDLLAVGEVSEHVRAPAGDVVVRQGEPGDELYVVMSGRVAILRDDKLVTELERGGVFGELALLDGEPRAATVIAKTDTELLRVRRCEFEALLDDSPALARGLIKTLLGHLRGGLRSED